MKKILLCLVAVLFSAGMLVGCGQGANDISAYAVFKPDTIYHYDGAGNALAAQDIFNDYIYAEKGLYQRRITAGDMLVGECIRIENGEMTSYFSSNQFNFFYDMTGAETNGSARVLQEPLKKGSTWIRSQGQTDEGETVNFTAEVTGENVDVTVPYGTFKALEVTVTASDSEEYVKEYYVKDIGLVKKLQHRISPESTADNTVYIDLTSQLSAIGENTGYADTGYFFYPILGTGEIDYFTSEIQHHTNEDAAAALETLLKSYPELPDGTFIGKDTKINSVELDYNEGKIKADFSKSLETALSQDPAAEELYLQALINTVGYYFDTSRVLITVEGAGYHGGVELSADEYRDVVATIHADNTLQESE